MIEVKLLLPDNIESLNFTVYTKDGWQEYDFDYHEDGMWFTYDGDSEKDIIDVSENESGVG